MQKPSGPLGNKRGSGSAILMTIVTLGIYCYWWSYATFEELKNHRNGQGIGGLIALILMFVGGSIAIPFFAGSEVGNLYAEDGQPKPVTGPHGMVDPPADRRGDRVVRQGPGRSQPLLGEQGRAGRRGRAGSSQLGGME